MKVERSQLSETAGGVRLGEQVRLGGVTAKFSTNSEWFFLVWSDDWWHIQKKKRKKKPVLQIDKDHNTSLS